jgi:hypothetical protein
MSRPLPQPMLLDDAEGCPGRYLRVRNVMAPICGYGCSRFGRPGALQPMAERHAVEGWRCVTRRSTGHVDTVAPVGGSGESLSGPTHGGVC